MAVAPAEDPKTPPEKPESETGMDKGEMKLVLAKSKRAPVNCAVGLSADARSALLLLHVTKKPKALVQDMIKSNPGAKNPRWGTAAVDFQTDPKLVKFVLNKPLSNFERKMIKTLKGTGYSKVDISDSGAAPD
jgi:hypothetical protein